MFGSDLHSKTFESFRKSLAEKLVLLCEKHRMGGKHPDAKPLKGFHGASVLEIVEDYDTDTYRAVYTVKFGEAVYVLHCFQKKSKSGISTPKQDMDVIEKRFKQAEKEHLEWQKQKNPVPSPPRPGTPTKRKRSK